MTPLLARVAIALGVAASAAGHVACSSGSCAATDGNLLLQRQGSVMQAGSLATEGIQSSATCDESSWPDKDHGLVCGECKVLVDRFSSVYETCSGYCEAVGRSCVGAWEESGDTCAVKHDMTCDETIESSDAICECGAKLSVSEGSTCYGELTHLAVEEGSGVGQFVTQSADECKRQCSDSDQCKSFSLCPQWNGCWMKDRSFTGGEPSRVLGECKTYYKTSCDGAAVPAPVPAPAPRPTRGSGKVKIASYNIYWWNAFGQNAWKGVHITDNIKDSLRADVLGLQECDNPGLIRDRTGYIEVSPFAGAQGVVAKPGLFTVGDSGKRDIEATGKWGPRYVTWAQLTHEPSGRTFWHFNTHWCVHSGNGQTCSADKRHTGAKNMLNIIREKAGNAPVIITGDFNAAMGEPGPQHFLQNGFSLAITHWVDAIFYSTDHWQLGQTSLGDAAHSDHRPIIAELEF